MCTVSWVHEDGGYQLLCNRDEKKTRGRAGAPQIDRRRGVTFLAPIDADFGGTWIAVNEYGVAVCLLNGANVTGTVTEAATDRTYRSRGHVVLDLVTSRSSDDICESVSTRDL